MTQSDKVIQFSPEAAELNRLEKEREEAGRRKEEEIRRRECGWENFKAWEKKQFEAYLEVAEWCFLNFKSFQPTNKSEAAWCVRNMEWLRNFLRSDVEIPNAGPSRRLGSIHRKISKHCQSPFTFEHLLRFGIEEEKPSVEELRKKERWIENLPKPSVDPTFKRRI
jgi:hypothetical protein